MAGPLTVVPSSCIIKDSRNLSIAMTRIKTRPLFFQRAASCWKAAENARFTALRAASPTVSSPSRSGRVSPVTGKGVRHCLLSQAGRARQSPKRSPSFGGNESGTAETLNASVSRSIQLGSGGGGVFCCFLTAVPLPCLGFSALGPVEPSPSRFQPKPPWRRARPPSPGRLPPFRGIFLCGLYVTGFSFLILKRIRSSPDSSFGLFTTTIFIACTPVFTIW